MNAGSSLWNAVLARDSRQDGRFFYAVTTTRVFCRPSCPSRRPLRKNVVFFRAPQEAERAGFRPCLRCRPLSAGMANEWLRDVCRYIEENFDRQVTLAELGASFHLSPFHLQRTFKAAMGVSPRQYADACRSNVLKNGLKSGHAVTRAMYDAGFGSSSRLYEGAASRLGMTPARYRDGGRGATIRFTFADSPLGQMLVAATEHGICSIQFGDSAADLERALRIEYPAAVIECAGDALRPWVDALVCHLKGAQPRLDLPLDVQATAFQRRVWEYLQTIPYGSTKSYGEVAAAIGSPTATRAVARACATNPVALAIPCHRVVRADGDSGGYRWGLSRKRKLLEGEDRSAS